MKPKQQLADYPSMGAPIAFGCIKFQGQEIAVFLRAEFFAEQANLFSKITRILRHYKADVANLVSKVGVAPAFSFLCGDCFIFTLAPKMICDPTKKAQGRLLRFIAHHPEFALSYLHRLHREALNSTAMVRAIHALRTAPGINSKLDKEIAYGLKVTSETVKKARQICARLDRENGAALRQALPRGKKEKFKSLPVF